MMDDQTLCHEATPGRAGAGTQPLLGIWMPGMPGLPVLSECLSSVNIDAGSLWKISPEGGIASHRSNEQGGDS